MKRANYESRQLAWQAHLNAAWTRAKKMPAWDKVARRFARYGPPQAPQDLLTKAHHITALLKGRNQRG